MARNAEKLRSLAADTNAWTFGCDATVPGEVARLFDKVDAEFGAPGVVVYNASYRTRGPLVELDKDAVAKSMAACAFGAFLVAQQAARRMLPNAHGAILFTGASASVKDYPLSAPFAMGKFALRGLAQSLARELQPKGIHVAHFVIDGAFEIQARRSRPTRRTRRTRCSIPMPSRKATCTCFARIAAPGHRRRA